MNCISNLWLINWLFSIPSDDPAPVKGDPNERNNYRNHINAYSISTIVNLNLDLKTFLYLISQLDVSNMFNTLENLYFSKTQRCRWDGQKMTRLNQDNQREDDLNKFRDVSSYLIKLKLIDENQKPAAQKSNIATLMMQQQNLTRMNSDSISLSNNSAIGGIYCRVEKEWQNRCNTK